MASGKNPKGGSWLDGWRGVVLKRRKVGWGGCRRGGGGGMGGDWEGGWGGEVSSGRGGTGRALGAGKEEELAGEWVEVRMG